MRTSPKLKILALLLGLSMFAILLPSSLTSSLNNVMQVFVPVQDFLSGVAANQPAPDPNQAVAMRNQIASLSLRIAELETENQVLQQIRGRIIDPNWSLLPAKVVASDSLPWRNSRLIDRGTLKGVRKHDAVLSKHLIDLDRGQSHGIEEGLSIISGESYVGETVSAATHTTRVLLVSDPSARPMLVNFGRSTDEGFSLLKEQKFMMHGAGGNELVIKSVHRDFIESGAIQPGDLVVTAPGGRNLPLPAVIGDVTTIKKDETNATLYLVHVRHKLDLARLRNVYVVSQEIP